MVDEISIQKVATRKKKEGGGRVSTFDISQRQPDFEVDKGPQMLKVETRPLTHLNFKSESSEACASALIVN